MTTPALERVFGTSRLKMVTGQYVEVHREAAAPGERRRYTKRFVRTREGDFREWTEREWRILARLVGHGARHVPDIVQYDRGAGDGPALVQTYDAGVTVDHWGTLLPVRRDGQAQRHIFQDCAHWWALARHLLLALHEIHSLQLVHLDLKADNICLPFVPPGFSPDAERQRIFPVFEQIALIDFAFSLVSGEALKSPLPIGWQRAYPYQSPRLLEALVAGQAGNLEPTCQLDWRCDMYSLAALLKAYLPRHEEIRGSEGRRGWTTARYLAAMEIVLKIVRSHDDDPSDPMPHTSLADACAVQLEAADLAESLRLGWVVDQAAANDDGTAACALPTPVTLIEPHAAAAGVATEIFVRRQAGHEAAAGPTVGPLDGMTTLPAASPADGIAGSGHAPGAPVEPVMPTRPAARIEAPRPTDAPPAAGAPTETRTTESTSGTATAAGRGPAPAEIGAAEPKEASEPSSIVRPASDRHLDERPPVARRSRLRVVAHGLPLLGLLATSAWWLVGHREAAGGASSATVPGESVAESVAAPAAEPFATPGLKAVVIDSPPRVTSTPEEARASGRRGLPVPERPAVAPPRTPPETPPDTSLGTSPETPPDTSLGTPPDPPPETPLEPLPADDRYEMRARVIVAQVLPAVVERASAPIARVLEAAAGAQDAADDLRTRQAANSIAQMAPVAMASSSGTAGNVDQSRRLNAAANTEFWRHGRVSRAFELQRRAFGANPHSPEIAGNLAFYALKMNPPQAGLARELAIFALTATGAAGPPRYEDWGSLAVASALGGRPDDATNAMLVLLSVSHDPNRSCRSAISSMTSFGPALQAPAAALLSRARARGHALEAPFCKRPPG